MLSKVLKEEKRDGDQILLYVKKKKKKENTENERNEMRNDENVFGMTGHYRRFLQDYTITHFGAYLLGKPRITQTDYNDLGRRTQD